MKTILNIPLLALLLVFILDLVKATELTFELPDSAKECFYEEIQKNTTATLEFQVNKQRLN